MAKVPPAYAGSRFALAAGCPGGLVLPCRIPADPLPPMSSRYRPVILALLLSSFGLAATEAVPAFRDPSLSFEQRADDLVGRLTTPEKISQMMMSSPAIPRLGIAAYDWWNEGLHGFARNGYATVFPQAIALAATWNPPLHERIAEVISTEARAKNNELIRTKGYEAGSLRYEGLTIWSPNINIFRDPRWGRGQETYGEDPFLTSRFAVAFVHGLQGNDPKYLKTVATLKHFAVHSGPEPLRHKFDAVVSERDLHETYLPAFEAGIEEGGAQSVMSAYNAIDGTPAPANRRLLTEILRDTWGFRGAVVGDVDTVADIYNPGGHHFAKDSGEASALAVKAGNDLCSGLAYEGLADALRRGLITEQELDVSLRRLLLLRLKLGQFDPIANVPYSAIPFSENDSPAHRDLALEAARQSLVLLKNNGTLPWNLAKVQTVAVIGPTAQSEAALLGNYHGEATHPVTLLDGIRAKLEPKGIKVLYEPGALAAPGFQKDMVPLPDGTIFTRADKKIQGLTGELFDDPALTGRATATRVDRRIDLAWNEFEPLPKMPIKRANVRWSGILSPTYSGNFFLCVSVTGGVRVYLDEHRVIDDWTVGDHRTLTTPVTFLAGEARHLRVEYTQGEGVGEVHLGWKRPEDAQALSRALAAARSADQVVLTLGLTPELEGEEMRVDAEGFKGGDRTSILLPATQAELLRQVVAVGKPVTVVLTTGSALSFDPTGPGAVLVAWYYGERGGDAVAEALVGETNPGGRLPVTFYQSDSDLPAFTDYSMANRTYRYFAGKPLYAFGFGLSYTSFTYSDLRRAPSSVGASDTIKLRVRVRNTGTRAGDEVVEVYARALHPPVAMPRQWLVGFERIHLEANSRQTSEIIVPVSRLRRWDEAAKRYVVDPGEYELYVGPASDNVQLKAPVTVR